MLEQGVVRASVLGVKVTAPVDSDDGQRQHKEEDYGEGMLGVTSMEETQHPQEEHNTKEHIKISEDETLEYI